jgi:hypothetical protein
LGFSLAILPAVIPAIGDVLSGSVTDADDGKPLEGAKIGLTTDAKISTLTAANGSFTLNTTPTGLLRWDAPQARTGRIVSGLFYRGQGVGYGAADGALRNALGALIGEAPESPVPARTSGPAAKAAAQNSVSVSKTGYTTVTQVVNGSQSGLAWKLKKAGTSRKANLTWFESYPDPGSEECIQYNGCTWAGQFAALSGKQPESWVKANNICAVHERDFAKYKLKTLRLVQGAKTIDVKVYDECSDSDCDGCCTKNASQTGFLIDVEKYTAERFGTRDGVVEWTCIDCTQ